MIESGYTRKDRTMKGKSLAVKVGGWRFQRLFNAGAGSRRSPPHF